MTPRRLELDWSDDHDRECLRIRGWTGAELRELGGLAPSELSRRLAVLPTELVDVKATREGLQPVAGSLQVEGDAVLFAPRFPFMHGTSYSLLVHQGGGALPEVWTVQRPARSGVPATGVTAIYPTADELPFNHLKFYVHFSNPMSEGWALRSLRVSKAHGGDVLEDVFLPLEPELWDRERRRLTVLLDPGRIKRGLAPHAEAGYPLTEGGSIIFSVDAQFRDAAGRPLIRSASRRYHIGPALRARVDPGAWRVIAPAAGSKDALVVEFDRPLDHALLEHSLMVTDNDGMPLAGQGTSSTQEQAWRFDPEAAWREGTHLVLIESHLEDLAGNSLLRVFDRDLERPEDAPFEGAYAPLTFVCARVSRLPSDRAR